jgi:hypothetical protein
MGVLRDDFVSDSCMCFCMDVPQRNANERELISHVQGGYWHLVRSGHRRAMRGDGWCLGCDPMDRKCTGLPRTARARLVSLVRMANLQAMEAVRVVVFL